MKRKQLSVLFLALFIQAVIYPVVIFHIYVEPGTDDIGRSLPADFADNGSSCYFGYNNNEEETHGENTISLFQESFSHTLFADLYSQKNKRFGFDPSHTDTHPEISTPPPEVI